jgi:hypothetical protein
MRDRGVRRIEAWRGLEQLPQQRRPQARRVTQQVVEHRRARALRADDEDRLDDRLLADLAVAAQQLLGAQACPEAARDVAPQTEPRDHGEIAAEPVDVGEQLRQRDPKLVETKILQTRRDASLLEQRLELQAARPDPEPSEPPTDGVDRSDDERGFAGRRRHGPKCRTQLAERSEHEFEGPRESGDGEAPRSPSRWDRRGRAIPHAMALIGTLQN